MIWISTGASPGRDATQRSPGSDARLSQLTAEILRGEVGQLGVQLEALLRVDIYH